MSGELPVCIRCCFCLPLRYGLIAWGYFKLIAAAIFITGTCLSLYDTIIMIKLYRNKTNSSRFDSDIAIGITVFIVLVTDFILTVVFIVGGHKKNVKLLRVFYFYSIAVLIMTFLLVAVIVFLSIEWWISRYLSFSTWMMNILNLSVYFVNIAVQIYFLLLVKSEITKLSNNCEFRFVNNAMEAQCTMKTDEEIADGDRETEKV